jgi:hypothetical protein
MHNIFTPFSLPDLIFLFTLKNIYGVQENFITEFNACDISHPFCDKVSSTQQFAQFSSNIPDLQQNAIKIIHYKSFIKNIHKQKRTGM